MILSGDGLSPGLSQTASARHLQAEARVVGEAGYGGGSGDIHFCIVACIGQHTGLFLHWFFYFRRHVVFLYSQNAAYAPQAVRPSCSSVPSFSVYSAQRWPQMRSVIDILRRARFARRRDVAPVASRGVLRQRGGRAGGRGYTYLHSGLHRATHRLVFVLVFLFRYQKLQNAAGGRTGGRGSTYLYSGLHRTTHRLICILFFLFQKTRSFIFLFSERRLRPAPAVRPLLLFYALFFRVFCSTLAANTSPIPKKSTHPGTVYS